MLERKLERADSTRGGDPWRAAATPDALNVATDPAPHVDRGESPDELRRRVRELQARLARAERDLRARTERA